MTEDQRSQLWDAFLERWPASNLGEMTLEQYTRAGSQDAFTYWLEARTESLGSVWGGSSFKFGVYHRKNREHRPSGRGMAFTPEYAWHKKYGDTARSAFERVRRHLCTIAEAAAAGDLKAIDRVDLGPAVKWKLAFLYQNRTATAIVPVFKQSHLRAYLGKGSSKRSMADLQAAVMRGRGDTRIFQFGSQVWTEAERRLNEGILTAQVALEYLNERFNAVDSPTQKLAGFLSDDGRELALELDRKVPSLYLGPGSWLRKDVKLLHEYTPEDRRHKDLVTQAPTLGDGNPACHVEVRTREALEALCDSYDPASTSTVNKSNKRDTMTSVVDVPLNQILFGPPGTGKTFHTVTHALEILDPEFLRQNRADRATLKKRYDEFLKEQRVRFVTFHQSFSYEEFVEGIRAEPDEKNRSAIAYSVKPGIFKKICEDARVQGASPEAAVRTGARVWKLSIGRRKDEAIRQECFRRGEARIGWGNVGDLTDEDRPKKEIEAFENEGDNNKHSLRTFAEDVQKGDIFLCLRSQTSVEAVGVVEGDYEFDPSDESRWDGYFHKRKVRWLAKNINFEIRSLNDGAYLTQKTIYELKRISPSQALGIAGRLPVGGAADAKPYVLIIDEINRANVSKVFGELITLVEPSKRAGREEALSVTLPYSGDPFSVPQNVYLIGTMNTADRSLATLDIALRRRFEFVEMAPDVGQLEGIAIDGIDISKMLSAMNERIEVLLDRDHALGHAYFLRLRQESGLSELATIFRRQILPLLREYFFEDWERIRWVLNDHRKKNPDHQFIVPPNYLIKSLLGDGPGIPSEARQWRVNEQALKHSASFSGIVDAQS